jgi:hypothetical protein
VGLSVSRQDERKLLCSRFKVSLRETGDKEIIGVASDVFDGSWPLNGLRCTPGEGESGWYIWSGTEMSEDPDYFRPVHACHLVEARPEINKYLALPYGWRILIAPGYEDVWSDESLLKNGEAGK